MFPTATGLKRRVLMMTDRLTCACATHIVPEGEGVLNDLASNGITRKPLRVLGHGNVRGIDLGRFDPSLPEVEEAARGLRRSGVFTFLFIGRLVGDKGINELVEAFSTLARERGRVRLVLVGRFEHELDPLEESTVREIHDNPAIEAVGQQSDVRPWLCASDAFVFPSYREGFPNVVIEAGAMGIPSIVTDINGSREIIREGENGTIIPTHDSASLLTAMRRFLDDTAATRRMAENSRRLVATRYEQSYVRGCLKDYYREILASKSPR